MAKILIVENHDEVAAIYKDILEQEGHYVERAVAAYGCVSRASKMAFDLVLMDLWLEGVNGAVSALALRGLGYKGPILVITGSDMPIEQEIQDAAGFAGRMLKPVLPRELIAEVNRHLAISS